jgi:hypothetical protein
MAKHAIPIIKLKRVAIAIILERLFLKIKFVKDADERSGGGDCVGNCSRFTFVVWFEILVSLGLIAFLRVI